MFSNKFRLFTANSTNNLKGINNQIFQNNTCINVLNKIMSCGFKDMRKLRKGKKIQYLFINISKEKNFKINQKQNKLTNNKQEA